MSEHRGTQARATNEASNSNFDPATALETLRAEVVDIEALACAAESAADALPAPATARQRVLFGLIQSLATKTSQQASASMRFANAAGHRAGGVDGGTPEGGSALTAFRSQAPAGDSYAASRPGCRRRFLGIRAGRADAGDDSAESALSTIPTSTGLRRTRS